MLTIVYQDCALCGARKAWGERTIAKALAAGQEIRKLSFASPEGARLCKEAIYAGVTRLPFITDGLKFSQEIEDFIEKPAKKSTKRAKKTEKKLEAEDGAI